MGYASYLFQDFRPCRAAYAFGYAALNEDRRFERGARLLTRQNDFVFARLVGGVAPWNTPHSSPVEVKRTVSALPEGAVIRAVTSPLASGSPFFSMMLAWSAEFGEPAADRCVVEPHGFTFYHVPLIGHPADHLAPEPVMIFVLYTLAQPPAPSVPMNSTLPAPNVRVTNSGNRP